MSMSLNTIPLAGIRRSPESNQKISRSPSAATVQVSAILDGIDVRAGFECGRDVQIVAQDVETTKKLSLINNARMVRQRGNYGDRR
jgi:hypothetical protein